MNHYPGVSHRTFGFRTLSNQRHEFDTAVNKIEQTKTIGIEEKRMLFERVQLDWVIERSGTLYKKTRMEQN